MNYIRNKQFQLICPHCHHEFAYDNGYYDNKIAELAGEIHKINIQHAEYKSLPTLEQVARKEWYNRSKKALVVKQNQLSELKSFRKICDQQVNNQLFQIWKNLVKERFGDEVYKELIKESEEELKCYQVTGMMRHKYTRSNAKENVTSINKL